MVLQSDAKKLLDPEESYPKVKYDTLLDKYRIPIQHFEYAYIETCKDGRELEKIVRILRSGEEGHFPDLTRCAENRLAAIRPKSKLLRKACPVLSKDSLDNDEKDEITHDLAQWVSNMNKDDDELVYFRTRKCNSNPFPQVRKTGEKLIDEPTSAKPQKRISATDYTSWDKYDPDTEILKMDLAEENLKKTALEKEKKKFTKKTVQFKEFSTDIEALRQANFEKDKGNEFFKTGDYAESLKHYTNSINCKPTLASFNNRALTNIKLKKYKNAMDDCHSALAIDPDNFKALLRKSQALDGLGRHVEALETAEQAIEVDANNVVAQELADKFRQLAGRVPKKSKRFVVAEIEKDQKNKKNAKTCSGNKGEVIIPIPGTSKMLPPYYIVCSDLNPDKVREHTAKANTPTQIVHLISVDNSDADDDDCCTVNHLKRICSTYNLDRNPSVSKETKPENKFLILQDKKQDPIEEEREEECSQEKKFLILQDKKQDPIEEGREKECAKTFTFDNRDKGIEKEESSSNLKRVLITENATNTMNHKSVVEDINETVATNNDKKLLTQKVIKEDKRAGGEPYVKDNESIETQQDIHSPYIFLKTWNSANNDRTCEQHASILRSIDMNRIVEVIGCKLDNTMFSTMVKCLCTHFAVPSEVDRLHAILTNIINIPRFDIIAMLAPAEDKNCVTLLVNFLKQHENPLSDHVVNKLLDN